MVKGRKGRKTNEQGDMRRDTQKEVLKNELVGTRMTRISYCHKENIDVANIPKSVRGSHYIGCVIYKVISREFHLNKYESVFPESAAIKQTPLSHLK